MPLPQDTSTSMHVMKRTGRSPWSTVSSRGGGTGSNANAASPLQMPAASTDNNSNNNLDRPDLLEGEPARIVSDIVPPSSSTTTPVPVPTTKTVVVTKAKSTASAPTFTPVPIPKPGSTLSQGSNGLHSAPALKSKVLSNSNRISALQSTWEIQQQELNARSRGHEATSNDVSSLSGQIFGDAVDTIAQEESGGVPNNRVTANLDGPTAPQANTTRAPPKSTPVPFPPIPPRLQDKTMTRNLDDWAELRPLRKMTMHYIPSASVSGGSVINSGDSSRRLSEGSLLKQLAPMNNIPSAQKTRSSLGSVAKSLTEPRKRPLTSGELVKVKQREYFEGPTFFGDSSSDDDDILPRIIPTSQQSPRAREESPTDSHTSLEYSRDGRSYYEHQGYGNSKNAPFPPGRLRSELEGKPFICPVRDCQTLLETFRGATSHFHGRHSGSLLNDNGDGTFSKVGTYKAKTGSSPGIIISQNSLPPGSDPPATPNFPSQKLKSVGIMHTIVRNKPSHQTEDTPLSRLDLRKRSLNLDDAAGQGRIAKRTRASHVLVSSASISFQSLKMRANAASERDVVRYLHTFLPPKQIVPMREDILALAQLKLVRTLPSAWLDHHKGTMLDYNMYACALAYIVGEAVKGPTACKKHSSRLSKGVCIILPRQLTVLARATFSRQPTCVGCRYYSLQYRQANACDWAKHQKPVLTEIPPDSDPLASLPEDDESDSDSGSGMGGFPELELAVGETSVKESSAEPISRAERSNQPPGGRPSPPANRLTRSSRQTRNNDDGKDRRKEREKEKEKEKAEVGARPLLVGAISRPGLEMEDWEFAPGTVKHKMTKDTMGFSNSYLTSGRPIMVSPDISCNVVVVKPGTSNQWSVQQSKLRTCFVGDGKVTVKINGDLFKMGTHGMFIIRPGQTCTVENRLYVDATIHCTTIEDYELFKR